MAFWEDLCLPSGVTGPRDLDPFSREACFWALVRGGSGFGRGGVGDVVGGGCGRRGWWLVAFRVGGESILGCHWFWFSFQLSLEMKKRPAGVSPHERFLLLRVYHRGPSGGLAESV